MPEQYGLNVIQELKKRYAPIGSSVLLAWKHASQQQLLGLGILEFHVVLTDNFWP
jgi:hypothetical protein